MTFTKSSVLESYRWKERSPSRKGRRDCFSKPGPLEIERPEEHPQIVIVVSVRSRGGLLVQGPPPAPMQGLQPVDRESTFVPHVELAAPLSAADLDPVGGPVAGSVEPRALIENFHQDRTQRVAALPVVRYSSFDESEGREIRTQGKIRNLVLLTASGRLRQRVSASHPTSCGAIFQAAGQTYPGAALVAASLPVPGADARCSARIYPGPTCGHEIAVSLQRSWPSPCASASPRRPYVSSGP